MEREHWHWKPNLEAEARAGNRRALAILAEGENPGRFFDGLTHMMEVVKVVRDEKKNGATHVGIFGSRIQKTSLKRRAHRPLDSDVDILVVKDAPKGLREVIRTGIGDGINIIRLSQDSWDYSEMHERDHTPVREIMRSVKWLWIKKGHFPHHVGNWVKMTF